MLGLSLSDDASKSDHGKALRHLRMGTGAGDFWVREMHEVPDRA
jgi:hypothetical protein